MSSEATPALLTENTPVNDRAKNYLDIMDVLQDVIARYDKGGFFDLVPYAARIEKIFQK